MGKELPVNGVDVILGNDLAERLSGNPQVCCFPEELRESSSEGLKYSDLQLPVAAVTRALSKKVVKEKLPGEDEALDLASLFETQNPLQDAAVSGEGLSDAVESEVTQLSWSRNSLADEQKKDPF